MAALTRADVKTLAEALLNAKGNLRWPDATKNSLADLANREVWDLLVDAENEWIGSRTSFSWPASAERVDLTSASCLNAEPKLVLDVYETESSGTPSDTNVATPWTPIDGRRRHRKRDDRDRQGRLCGASPRVAWSLQGNFMYATPPPSDARNLHVEWVPQATPLSADGTEVLSGQAEAFGDAVAFRLAVLMNAKDNHNPAIGGLWEEAQRRIAESSSRQGQRNAVVGSRTWS